MLAPSKLSEKGSLSRRFICCTSSKSASICGVEAQELAGFEQGPAVPYSKWKVVWARWGLRRPEKVAEVGVGVGEPVVSTVGGPGVKKVDW